MQNKLFILISTIDDRILNLKNIIQGYNKYIIYVIGHQITRELDQNILNFIDNLSKRKTELLMPIPVVDSLLGIGNIMLIEPLTGIVFP